MRYTGKVACFWRHVQVQAMIRGRLDVRKDDKHEVKPTTKEVMQISEGWTGCDSNLG